MADRKTAYDLIKEAGYCVPTQNDDGTITWDCVSGTYTIADTVNRVSAKTVVLNEHGKPMLNRTVGDFLVAKELDVLKSIL